MQKDRLGIVRTRGASAALPVSPNDWLRVGSQKAGPKTVSFRVEVRVYSFRTFLIEERTHGPAGPGRRNEALERGSG